MILDAEAEVVRSIFGLYANGHTSEDGGWRPMTLGAIARHLNDLGHRLPMRRTGKIASQYITVEDGYTTQAGELRLFEPGDIRRILKSRFYLGFLTRGETQLSKWVRDQGAAEVHHPHLQVIDVTAWQKVARTFEERNAGPRRSTCAMHALTGVLRCYRCGGLLAPRPFNRTRPDGRRSPGLDYRCITRWKYGAKECEGHSVPERLTREAVEILLLEALQALRLQRFLEQAASDAAMSTEDQQYQAILTELHQTEQQIGRLVRAVAEGAFSPAEARNVKLELIEKKQRLETRLAKLQAKTNVRDELLEAVAYVSDNLPELLHAIDGPRFNRLVRMVFKRIVPEIEGKRPAWRGTILDYEHTDQYRELVSTFGGSTTASP